jgi:hypothetical protein
MFKTSKKNKKKCQISVDNPCCYAAHNSSDKLEETEKVFGLAMGKGFGFSLTTQKVLR